MRTSVCAASKLMPGYRKSDELSENRGRPLLWGCPQRSSSKPRLCKAAARTSSSSRGASMSYAAQSRPTRWKGITIPTRCERHNQPQATGLIVEDTIEALRRGCAVRVGRRLASASEINCAIEPYGSAQLTATPAIVDGRQLGLG